MESFTAKTKIIVVTGAESTGKTALAMNLAKHYKIDWVPELAREYVEKLNRPYAYEDVEQIAQKQIKQFEYHIKQNSKYVIFDTGLIITKVWFDVVYDKHPKWLITAIEEMPKFVHLLCNIDLPWQPDPVRENGGEMRKKLHEMYKEQLSIYDIPYRLISGIGEQRFQNAKKALGNILQH